MARKNPVWQAEYDSRWYLYVTYDEHTPDYDKTFRKLPFAGKDRARKAALAFTYNPKVVALTVYSSKRSRAKGVPAKFRWTRTTGWRVSNA